MKSVGLLSINLPHEDTRQITGQLPYTFHFYFLNNPTSQAQFQGNEIGGSILPSVYLNA